MQAFFVLAAVAPNRQRTFRTLVVAHCSILLALLIAMSWRSGVCGPVLAGQVLLVTGIIEGALLIGWRLTQLPKSQALEFLLVSSLRPPLVLLGEGAVEITRLALVTLAGLPILILMVGQGLLLVDDLPVLLALPFVFGAVTGLGLTAWAYEPDYVRRWGEKFGIMGVLVYLILGVLAGEHLAEWLHGLPFGLGGSAVSFLRFLHEYNPFGGMQFAMEHPSGWVWHRLAWVTGMGIAASLVLLMRSAFRLHGHFHDEHYRPNFSTDKRARPDVGEDPLTWWAVKRVTRYSGQINVWLAGGFSFLYAIYTVAEPYWPVWMGRGVFQIFDRLGGLPMLATAMMILASVPAAFQYGLWDSNAQDRCRRLELLLLTRINGYAYWQAAGAAAWRRGRGYFAVALFLWLAAAVGERITWVQATAGFAAGVILCGLYFVLGFRAFSRGLQANRLGMALTLLLPMATFLLAKSDWQLQASWLPPGSVYFAAAAPPDLRWLLGPATGAIIALLLARRGIQRCDAELRRWYDVHHGSSRSA